MQKGVRALLVKQECERYLREKDWYQDGDDEGIWIKRGSNPTPRSITEALAIQFAADGV